MPRHPARLFHHPRKSASFDVDLDGNEWILLLPFEWEVDGQEKYLSNPFGGSPNWSGLSAVPLGQRQPPVLPVRPVAVLATGLAALLELLLHANPVRQRNWVERRPVEERGKLVDSATESLPETEVPKEPEWESEFVTFRFQARRFRFHLTALRFR